MLLAAVSWLLSLQGDVSPHHLRSNRVPLRADLTAQHTCWINLSAPSFRYDGIGAVSGGGATSKLLMAYDEDVREEMFRLMFHPQLGGLNMLKVEIGGDDQSTEGTEPSHAHFEGDANFRRGYEWEVMKLARKFNPSLRLCGLPWAFPGWVGDGTGDPYHNVSKTAKYVVAWVEGAKREHGLDISCVGGWNEKPFSAPYLKALRSELDSAGFENVQIVASDQFKIPELEWRAILASRQYWNIVGEHYPSRDFMPGSAPNFTMWASEDYSTFPETGAGCLAHILNTNPVKRQLSGTFIWHLFSSFSTGLPWYATGLLTASDPPRRFQIQPAYYVLQMFTRFVDSSYRILKKGRGGSGGYNPPGTAAPKSGYTVYTNGSQVVITVENMYQKNCECVRPADNTCKFRERETLTFFGDWLKGRRIYQHSLRPFESNQIIVQEVQVSESKSSYSFQVSIERNELLTLATFAVDFSVSQALASKNERGQTEAEESVAPRDSFGGDNFQSYSDFVEPYYLYPQKGSWEVVNHTAYQTVSQPPISWCASRIHATIALFDTPSKDVWKGSVYADVSIPSKLAPPLAARAATQAPPPLPRPFVAHSTNCTGCGVEHCVGVFAAIEAGSRWLTVQYSLSGFGPIEHYEMKGEVPFDTTCRIKINLELSANGHNTFYVGVKNDRTELLSYLPITSPYFDRNDTAMRRYGAIGSLGYGITAWDEYGLVYYKQ